MAAGQPPPATPAPLYVDGTLRCSFCGSQHDQVGKLFAGPGVYICSQCVTRCHQALADELDAPEPASTSWNERGCWSGVPARPTAAPMPCISPGTGGGCWTG